MLRSLLCPQPKSYKENSFGHVSVCRDEGTASPEEKKDREAAGFLKSGLSHSPGDACLLENSHRGRKKLHVCPYEGLGSRVQRAQPAGEAVVRFFAKTRADGAHKRCGEKRAGS